MNINQDLSPVFLTSDLGLASTLSIWKPIHSIDKTNPDKVNFIFIRDGELQKLLDQYWKKEIRVEPQQYFQQIKYLKTRIHSE